MGDAAINVDDLRENARRASVLLKAMCNERRLLILCHLAGGEKSVGEMEKLVATRRAAQTIFYSLAGGESQAVMATLHALYCGGKPAPARRRVLAAQ